MARFLLVAGAAAVALTSPVSADPGKNESGKGGDKRWEQVKKSREKAFEAHKKLAEKRQEAAKKWAEHRDKRSEKAFEQTKTFEEKRFEAARKWDDKGFEHRSKQMKKAAEGQRKAWERAYKPDWKEAYEQRARQLGLVGIGQRLDRDRFGYVPSFYRSRYPDTRNYYYRYDDGYLYRVNRGNNVVSALVPLLGAGYRVGQLLPVSYADPVPEAYSRYYYDTDEYYYRYGDGAIYQVNAQTGIIQSIAALLTGNRLGVGQTLPIGYDAYNVPLQYRDRYYDTADNWYRYNDGYIYQVDPTTRLIQAVISAIA